MRWNVLGNGDHAYQFKRGTEGKLLICNMPPFEIPKSEVHATCMVDYKMMQALAEGKIRLDMYDWILGTRPRHWMELNPAFYMKYAPLIKAMHTHVPEYAQLAGQDANRKATNYSCGHMAVDYACRAKKATEVHIYGFDSMFDTTLRSYTDLLLSLIVAMRTPSVWQTTGDQCGLDCLQNLTKSSFSCIIVMIGLNFLYQIT